MSRTLSELSNAVNRGAIKKNNVVSLKLILPSVGISLIYLLKIFENRNAFYI